MNPLNKEQKSNITLRLSFIETELSDLKSYSNLNFEVYKTDRMLRRNVERILENVINACIDIAKILLAGEEVEIPSTYADVFISLGDVGMVEKDLANKMASLVKDRNILAHEYLDLKWQLIDNFLKIDREEVEKFLRIVEEKIKS